MVTLADTFINQCLGRYRIVERIGAGGMARVYKARDTNLDREVAIKILHDHLAEDSTFKDRFDREARLVASLNHPNIIQIFDYATVDLGDRLVAYMVMPYIPGRTLKEELDDLCASGQRMSTERVRAIMLDITAALHYAHNKGMVHRDVKPGNILFDEHNRAVLGDFGIARLAQASSLTNDGATVGTPTYLSPEQAAGMPVDGRSDLYALGVMLYEMLTGTPPFAGDSAIAVILKHINQPVASITPIHANPALNTFVQRALAKNPDDRYQTAQDFADDLAFQLGNTPPPTTMAIIPTTPDTTTLLLPPLRAQRRNFSPRNIGIALAALTVAILFVLLASHTSDVPVIASMTEGDNTYFISDFASNVSENAGWPQTTTGSILREFTSDGLYRLQNNQTGVATATIHQPSLRYADGSITLEGRLDADSNPASAYGIIFGYQDESNYNVFAVNGLGRYSIWELRDANWHELRDLEEHWTPDASINPVGESNRLSITFSNAQISAWVNDFLVLDLTSEAGFSEGAVGIYLASDDKGSTTALIDSYQISGGVRSMTETS